MLAKIAQMEAVIADLRTMLTDPTAPTTPVKAKAVVSTPGAPMKAMAHSLTDDDMDAMVRAGVKAKAQIKTLGKTVFDPLGIPESSWSACREQWMEYRSEIADDEAETLASELVLTEEICEALKDCTDAKTKKPFDATTRTKKLADEFASHDIHPVLFDRAGKEWREWAEAHGLGKRAKAPLKTTRTAKAPKAPKEDLLTADMLATIQDSTDKNGKAFHSGSQKRTLADTLTGLGIEEADHARAAKEWRAYAKAEGISSKTSSKASSKASSKGSDGVPEELTEGVGPILPKASVSKTAVLSKDNLLLLKKEGYVSDASVDDLQKMFDLFGIAEDDWDRAETEWRKWAKENNGAKSAAAGSRSTKILRPDQFTRLSHSFSSVQNPEDADLTKALKLIGIRSSLREAIAEWREWAKDNHHATDDETEHATDDEDDEIDLS